MAKKSREPRIVRPDDIDPHHRWDRPLPAPGHTQVDFEERIDFRRLHDYRLSRTRETPVERERLWNALEAFAAGAPAQI